MHSLETPQDLNAALEAPVAVVLKYSTTCPISANARRELSAFEQRHPDQTVYGVDVHRAPQVSRALADRLGVQHESPQAFILRGGEPVWTATHWSISADEVARELGAAR